MKSPDKQPKTIDEYIAGFPDDVQLILEKLRDTIKKAAPGAEEIISYQIPCFKLNGNLVYFGGWKTHIGFYPGSSAIKTFKNELEKYGGAKGTLKFPLNKPIPYQVVSRIVKLRVKENQEKAKAKAKAKKK